MFNHHQAKITVMQFRGHSLLVHHSVVYHGNYLVPFHQPISAHTISSPDCYWNVSLPSGASPWNSIFWGPGRRLKYNIYACMRWSIFIGKFAPWSVFQNPVINWKPGIMNNYVMSSHQCKFKNIDTGTNLKFTERWESLRFEFSSCISGV